MSRSIPVAIPYWSVSDPLLIGMRMNTFADFFSVLFFFVSVFKIWACYWVGNPWRRWEKGGVCCFLGRVSYRTALHCAAGFNIWPDRCERASADRARPFHPRRRRRFLQLTVGNNRLAILAHCWLLHSLKQITYLHTNQHCQVYSNPALCLSVSVTVSGCVLPNFIQRSLN